MTFVGHWNDNGVAVRKHGVQVARAKQTITYNSRLTSKHEAPGSGASNLQPLLFKICPAYPNPFNSTTTINYTITTTSGINLSIYNTQGQLVETLLDRMMPAGRHSVVWEADQVPAGVYLVRMQDEGGGMNGMQKVVLMR